MAEHDTSDRGYVVVTGTSTGIGAAAAQYLGEHGYSVFAGVLPNEADAIADHAEYGLTPLALDITDEASIAAARQVVGNAVGDRGLAGLVNNAGIVMPGPLEFQPLTDLRWQLEVNLFGQLAVTQAFLPLIRAGGGRIVNVGSIGGRIVLPLHGAYSASKFGMEAVSDALRIELRRWGIHVALVDPGATDTAIFGKTLESIDAAKAELQGRGIDLYNEHFDAVRELVVKTAAAADPPIKVAEAIGDALMAKHPKTRYLAGHEAKSLAAVARTMPGKVKDLLVEHEAHLPK